MRNIPMKISPHTMAMDTNIRYNIDMIRIKVKGKRIKFGALRAFVVKKDSHLLDEIVFIRSFVQITISSILIYSLFV